MTSDTPPDPPLVLESMLLSVAHYWSRKETADRVVELLERSFRQDEMFAAQKELAEMMKRPTPPKRQGSSGSLARSATKAQAQNVIDTLVQLGNEDKLPRFTVQSDDLGRVHTLSHSCLKVHAGVPIVLIIFLDPLVIRVNCLVIRELLTVLFLNPESSILKP